MIGRALRRRGGWAHPSAQPESLARHAQAFLETAEIAMAFAWVTLRRTIG